MGRYSVGGRYMNIQEGVRVKVVETGETATVLALWEDAGIYIVELAGQVDCFAADELEPD
jgi:hypothetical protein